MNGDPPLPNKRDAIDSVYCLWRSRKRRPLTNDEDVLKEYDLWVTEETNKKRGKPSEKK